jgi:hypothetical protein
VNGFDSHEKWTERRRTTSTITATTRVAMTAVRNRRKNGGSGEDAIGAAPVFEATDSEVQEVAGLNCGRGSALGCKTVTMGFPRTGRRVQQLWH